MTKYSETWKGTKQDFDFILNYMIRDMRKEYPHLTDREIKAVLCESLARNFAQAEIAEMVRAIVTRVDETEKVA